MITWHSITRAAYDAASDIDKSDDKLFYLYDTGEIYKGTKSFTESVIFYTEEPDIKAAGKLYVNTNTLEGKIWAESDWITVMSLNKDWSQNDPSSADFIKNRTHYDVLSERCIVQYNNWDGALVFNDYLTYKAADISEYVDSSAELNADGEYTLTVKSFDGTGVYADNIPGVYKEKMFDLGQDNWIGGIDFGSYVLTSDKIVYTGTETAPNYAEVVEVYDHKYIDDTKKINARYLPDVPVASATTIGGIYFVEY